MKKKKDMMSFGISSQY